MEQLNDIDNGLLWKALANPAENAAGVAVLVDKYPQSGLLRAMLAGNGNERNIKHAAVYINPTSLCKIVNAPDTLPVVSQKQIIWADGASDLQVEEKADEVIEEPVAEYHFGEDIKHEEVNNEPDAIVTYREDIEDDVYDEIVSIEDIYLEQISAPANQESDPIEKTDAAEEPVSQIPENDHFVIDSAFTQEQPDNNIVPDAPATKPAKLHINNNDLSRYNDETMPYSFMWWLDKTRKEYAGTYQPYVVFNAGPAQPPQVAEKPEVDELQQQYVESIFNLNAIEELERSTSVSKKEIKFDTSKKEDRIIKRFIQAEPQIKHPTNIMDNENKARRSSEDADEFVTETLARIYTEQMLYQKAINAYKKLMLKFPEKSVYFAGQIEQIEKKSN